MCFLKGGGVGGFRKCGLHVDALAGQLSDPLKRTTEVSVVIHVIGKEHGYAADNQTQSLTHAKHMLSTCFTTELCPRVPHRLLRVAFTTGIKMFYPDGVLRMWGKNSRPGARKSC